MAPAEETSQTPEIPAWRLDCRNRDNVQDFVNHAGYPDGLPFVKAFLDHNGPEALELPNDKGETAFLRAADHGLADMMDFLASRGAKTDLKAGNERLLFRLARYGNRPGVNWLAAHGAGT